MCTARLFLIKSSRENNQANAEEEGENGKD